MFDSLKNISKELKLLLRTNDINEKRFEEINNIINLNKEKLLKIDNGNLFVEQIEQILNKDWKPEIPPNALVRLEIVDED